MKVIICGAGQVGYGIAERLAAEKNDVSVIDTSPRLVQSMTDTLHVQGLVGHGSHPDMLAQAGAEHADMLIAVTLHDEVNLLACQVAHTLFKVPTTIARVRAQGYLAPRWNALFTREHLPVDVVISPELEVGEMVLRRLSMPGAADTVSFADDRVVVMGILCSEDCPVLDTPLRQLTELFPDLKARVVGIKRGDKVCVPHGGDSLNRGDLVYVMAERSQARRVLGLFGRDDAPATRVVIAGGGNIGMHVAKAIEKKVPNASVKIIEADTARATAIADQLQRGVVLNGSALDENILREADITSADTMVALTNDEKINVMASVMARNLGCRRNLCLLNTPSYSKLAANLGVDAEVNPRAVTVSRILRHVRRGRIRAVHSLLNGAAELVEAEALETSPLVGRPLSELDGLDGIRIGAIYRDGEVILPRGDTVIQARDRVILFTEAGRIHKVEQMVRVSVEFI